MLHRFAEQDGLIVYNRLVQYPTRIQNPALPEAPAGHS